MKIEKLPSGHYRVRKMFKGKTYTVIFDYEPNQKQAIKALSDEMEKDSTSSSAMTFNQAAEKYFEMKSNVLSPSTIKGYKSILRNLPSDFTGTKLSNIDGIMVQKIINQHSKTHTAKCTKNVHGFISVIMGTFAGNVQLNTTLPQKDKKEPYIPTDDEVKQVAEAIRGSMFEVAVMLGCFGMRRSEICALTIDDINGNIVRINKAMVQNAEKEWIVKKNKTTESTRSIWIPDNLVELITKQGYVYNGHPGSISRKLNAIQDELGIPRFSLHKLRHYYASTAHAQGIPTKYIMDAGGWKSESVLNSVYSHALRDRKTEMQKKTGDHLSEILFD